MKDDQDAYPPRPEMGRESRTFEARRLLVMCLFVVILLVGSAFSALVLAFDATGKGGLTPLLAVIVAGAGGGFVSNLRRLYGAQEVVPSDERNDQFNGFNLYVLVYSCVPALVGMIGAVVLYLVFAAGLLKGDAFPEFVCAASKGCDEFRDFVSHWRPSGSAAYAKAIVWGFVAGFSERFVPDLLLRLGSNEHK